jgi:hypothetical protein
MHHFRGTNEVIDDFGLALVDWDGHGRLTMEVIGGIESKTKEEQFILV